TYELSGFLSDRAGIAHMLVHLGERDQARKIVEEIENQARNSEASYDIAKIYAALQRREEAIKWLELAYEARAGALTYIHLDRDFDWLQSDPRFRDLVKQVGLPQEFH